MSYLAFESWWLVGVAGPLAVLALVGFARRHAVRPRLQWMTLLMLRGVAFLVIVMLLARPVWISPRPFDEQRRRVALLIDQSESMSLEDMSGSRYRAAVRLARDQFVPALESAGLEVDAFLFSDQVTPATGREIADSAVDGKQTNLAGAIVQAISNQMPPPLALIALTDGNATDPSENERAIGTLRARGVPFIGIGFGSEAGVKTLSIEEVMAPSRVPPDQEFRFAVRLQSTGGGEFPPCELVLLRNGRLHDRRTLSTSAEPRIWQETFRITEDRPGRYVYRVQLLLPEDRMLKSVRSESTVLVDITDEEQWRILFVQGGLTWDFKFIHVAVRGDPALRLSGLSRTASDSRFFQNVEEDELLSSGFPTTLDQLSAFRVVVLANLRPADLRPAQQELLVRYCGESGGGVVMIGGGETFHGSWRESPLEQLLPVRFALGRRRGNVSPFQPRLTSDALQHPVFQISGDGDPGSVWRSVPQLTDYAEVAGVKLGAEVWAEHPRPHHQSEPAPLIAVQRFGLGRSAAFCVPNLWRWRLAKSSDPRHYDRFWQQLFRFMGGGDQDPVAIHLADQDLTIHQDLRATLEIRSVGERAIPESRFWFQVETLDHQLVAEQAIELSPQEPTEVTFRVREAGTYTLRVLDSARSPQGTRTLELKDREVEFASPTRNLDALRQWAAISDGVALPAEECRDASQLVDQLQKQSRIASEQQPVRHPVGVHWTTFAVLLSCLAIDWGLRKRWNWV